MRSPARSSTLAFAALLAAVVGPALAADSDQATPGALSVSRPDGTVVEMPLRHTKVAIEVTAFVARATLEQVFANPFDEPVEAVYTFPLGDRAAVDDFELVVGDRTIRGEIERREEARETYERARASGYQAALLEQERPNVFTQSVANLEPGKTVTVRLRTIETLRYERGTYRLTFPLVVGPRYFHAQPTAAGSHPAPPSVAPGTRSGHDVEIAVTIDAGVPLTRLESPSHRTVIAKSGAAGATVRLAEDDAIPNKDFLLRWSVASDRPAVGLLTHRDGLDGFFTLLVQPKGEVAPTEAAPKEITFVVDTSGSMSGIPLEASKRFAAKALRALGPRDTFNLIRFAGDNEAFSNDPLPNERGAIERAISWLNRKQGGGGTELLSAIEAAFARPADPNRLRVVVFLTDGFVGDDTEILDAIAKVIGGARLYTVGIGTSVNHHLLDRMADLGRGAYVFVRPDESADDALEAFRSWVTLPYLTDFAIDWGALPIADLAPDPPRDLGSGQTFSVVGRYLSAGEGNIVVRGRLGGRYWEQTVHVVLPEREARNEALSSLWARGRIEELMRAAGNPAPDSVKAEVIALALNYRLMSPYTSFVAVDDSRVVSPSGAPRKVEQALPLPEGVSFEGIFGKDGPGGVLEVDQSAARPEDGEPIERVVVVGERTTVDLTVVTAGAGAEFGRAQGGFARIQAAGYNASPQAPPPAAKSLANLPVAGRVYENVLKLAPGVQDPDGDGNPNVNGARERDFKAALAPIDDEPEEAPAARERLLDAALRVLADLADDGRLSPAEGRPALAALLAAQRRSGSIADDVAVHAIATWALAEAAVHAPDDPWIARARAKAVDRLASLATPEGWPARHGGSLDAEATRWARLVLGAIRPEALGATVAPQGDPAKLYAQLRASLAAARVGAPAPTIAGRAPFDRLARTIGRGNLKIVR